MYLLYNTLNLSTCNWIFIGLNVKYLKSLDFIKKIRKGCPPKPYMNLI